MKQFQIYKNNVGIYEAVKKGWSWPAFFFSWIWCYVKKIHSVGTGILIFSIFVAFIPSGEITILLMIIGWGINIWIGSSGNEYRVNNLKMRGYKYQGKIVAPNPEVSISEFTNKSEEVDFDDDDDSQDEFEDTDISEHEEPSTDESMYLEFQNGSLNGQRIMVFKSTTIGRSSGNDIVLNDKKISGTHSKISIEDDEFIIEDLNSTNGTYVNGKKISKSKIELGDELKLSSIKIKVG